MGGQFEEYNPVSIVFAEHGSGKKYRSFWEVRKNMSAAEYITITSAANPPRLGLAFDYVYLSDNVCIPAWNADGTNFSMDLRYGFLKCQDSPSPPTIAPTTEASTTVTTLAPVAPVCDPEVRQTLLDGDGSWKCEEKKVRKGKESYFKCTVSCSDGANHKGPRYTRCKTFDYKTKRGEERKSGIWYTNKNKGMSCSKKTTNPMAWF